MPITPGGKPIASAACRLARLSLFGLACFAGAEFGMPALAAIQFVEESTVRFPQPDPLDYSNQVGIADIDGDGDLDIVWANGGGFSTATAPQVARIYVNNGAGVFTDESAARGAASGRFRGVEFGDIDNDADLDMILAEDFNHQPRLLVNDGTGRFADGSAARLPAISLSCTRAEFGDIDNDGDLDLYLTNGGTNNRFGSGQNQIWTNDGAGHFADQTAARHPVAVLSQPMDAIFGDIDGDFDLDVRAGSRASGGSRFYRNDGSGVFATVSGVPADNNCYSYDFGDIDGDGDLDALGANGNPSTPNAELLLKNDGTGAFTNVSAQISPNPPTDDNDSKFLDLDNDGDLDLVIAHLGSTAERIYRNDGAGNFTEVTGLITPVNDSSLDVKVADLNGDGRLDVVTAQGESGSFRNRVYMNNGPADTRPPRIVATEQAGDTLDTTGPYIVRAAILDDMSSDRDFLARSVSLAYSVGGGTVQFVPMLYSGGQIWRGAIPGAACGGIVSYSVAATDFAGNTGAGSTRFFTVTPPPAPPGAEAGDDDGDGVPNATDCARCDAAVWAAPGDVTGVTIAADRITLGWASLAAACGPATTYDLLRGDAPSGLPVGSGLESCLANDLPAPTTTDAASPPAGAAFWYLVRGQNRCGTGGWGSASSGAARLSAVCP